METITENNKSDAEIVQSAMKGYKNSASSKLLKDLEKNKVSQSGTVKRLLNLTGPKTLEGRLRSQANLKRGTAKKETSKEEYVSFDPSDPMSSFFIDDKEKQFYEERKQKYIDEFSLNESIDKAILDQILQEEIVLNRLSMQQRDYFKWMQSSPDDKKKSKIPPTNPTDEINAARKRFREATNLLAAGKKDRKSLNEGVGNDLASLSQRFSKMGRLEDDGMEEEILQAELYLKTSGEKREAELRDLGLEE